MFVVSEAEAAAIRTAFEQQGELSAAIELRRLFPGITDNLQARECRARHRRLEAAAATPSQAASAPGALKRSPEMPGGTRLAPPGDLTLTIGSR